MDYIEDDEDWTIWLAIGVVFGGVATLLAVLLVVCCVRMRREDKRREERVGEERRRQEEENNMKRTLESEEMPTLKKQPENISYYT